MTLGFESENLFLFEDGTRRLALVDIASWRGWWMDFEHLGVGIADAALDALAENVRLAAHEVAGEARRLQALHQRRAADPDTPTPDPADAPPPSPADLARLDALAAADPDGRGPAELARHAIARATDALGALLPLRVTAEGIDIGYHAAPTGLLRPARAALWLFAGDAPAESFHADDYDPGQVERLDTTALAEFVDFGVTFDAIRSEPCHFPTAEEGGHCAISLPAGFASEARPDPLRTLPILDDYVGPGGVGVAGVGCNLADDGTFADEVRMAIPFLRAGALFLTLYLHVGLDLPAPAGSGGLLLRLLAGQAPDARAALTRLGFALHHHDDARGPIGARLGSSGEVWTRGDEHDVIHLYDNLPGREALHRGVTPPFLLPARAGGGFDADARAALLRALKAEL